MKKTITTPEYRPATVTADNGAPITINVPTGPFLEPTARAQAIFDTLMNPKGWKFNTKAWVADATPENETLATELEDCLIFYLGGAERIDKAGKITLGSLGYYHYIGA